MRGAGEQEGVQAMLSRCPNGATTGAERAEAGAAAARARARARVIMRCALDACVAGSGTGMESVCRTCAHGARAATYLSLRLR